MAQQATAQVTRSLATLTDELNKTRVTEIFLQMPNLNASLAAATPNAAEIAAGHAANKNWEILGTNSSDDDVTFATGGGVLLTPDGSAADQIFVVPHQDADQSSLQDITWSTSNEIACGFKLQTSASIAGVLVLAGYTSDMAVEATFVLGDNDDELYFYYNPASSANWQAATSRGGTDTLKDLGSDFAVAASTSYKLEIALDADRVPHFYIDGELAHKAAAMDATTDLFPRVGLEHTATSTAALTLRKMIFAQNPAD